MKKMKLSKRLACLVLAVLMAVPVASALDMPQASVAEAASAKKVTMYVGEKMDLGFTNTEIKKLKTSNKKVVKTGTYKSYSYKHSYIEAKKTGKATITVKKYSKTYKYAVTVKKAKFSATATRISGTSRFLITLNNKTNQTFENVKMTYTIKDSSGNVIDKDSTTVTDLQAKGKAYELIYTSYSYADQDLSCSVKVTPLFHQMTQKYYNVSNKIKVTSKKKDGNYVKISYKNNNKKATYTDGCVYVIFYDENGKVVSENYSLLYMKKGTTKTSEFYVGSNWSSYKVIVNAWYSK